MATKTCMGSWGYNPAYRAYFTPFTSGFSAHLVDLKTYNPQRGMSRGWIWRGTKPMRAMKKGP